jgi:L-2-hydroxyglutarate oxidase
MLKTDLAVIGGGIVGLATAWQYTRRFPGRSVVVLEKEPGVGRHQSGRNSGVLHTGIYYAPGSLKALTCREGKRAMEAFCEAEGIPWRRCGKVVVAVDTSELDALQALYERGRANEVDCRLIGPERLRELEPHAAGVRAIHVPETGITDFAAVCDRLASRIGEAGGVVLTRARVRGLHLGPDGVVLALTHDEHAEVLAAQVVNCAGLYCDHITRLSGQRPEAKILPFRGEYYALKTQAHHLVNALIYPVPDPRFPFLGAHFTRMIDGQVECGPNAVLAFAREGYRRGDIRPLELLESLTYPGFLRLIPRYGRLGLGEIWRSVSKPAFVKALRRLVPEVRAEHLVPAPAGVRAQAVRPDGYMVDDFLIQTGISGQPAPMDQTEPTGQTPTGQTSQTAQKWPHGVRTVHVGNAPSPAATASLVIGLRIVEELAG